MKPSDERLVPFYDIATKKGKKITFLEPEDKSLDAKMADSTRIHLDMDMVEASLIDAILQAQRNGSVEITRKLILLREKGTDVEKINFVYSSGTYYFPEDLAKMAADSRAGVLTGQQRVCETICHEVCRCIMLGPDGNAEQVCRELCKTICSLA